MTVARIRSVHPDICVSEAMARVSPSGERSFVRLWTHCDDEGRCAANPRLIAAALYPLHDSMTAEVVESDLNELEDAGLIHRYSADDGKLYLVVKSWDQYQHPQRPTKSRLPDPPSTLHETSAKCNGENLEPSSLGEGEGEGEGEGGGGGGGGRASRRKPKVPIPDEFTVSLAMIAWAEKNCASVDWRHETKKFTSYWKAEDGRKANWEQAWRTWMHKASEWKR